MKQTLTLIALIFFCLSSSAQSGTDLEFSRTINEKVTINQVLGPVPLGKIWKLVGFSCNTSNPKFKVNGEGNGTYLRSNTGYEASLPLFFNESDEIQFVDLSTGECYVSFVEYTVIP
ncbi:MAG TPA: hypothetical protein DCR04_05885 [Flavobacteriales bacterium]|nr:hypothetical protein [Flavobacteriales bacterium]